MVPPIRAFLGLSAGGVIVVGEQTIAYYSLKLDTFRLVIPQPTIFECYTRVNQEKEEYILGDADGQIYSLSIENGKFSFSKLGEVPLVPIPRLDLIDADNA